MGCVKLLIQALVSKQSPELALDAAWALNEMVRGAARGCCCHCHCGNVTVGMWPFVACEVESGLSSDSHRFTMIYTIDMFFIVFLAVETLQTHIEQDHIEIMDGMDVVVLPGAQESLGCWMDPRSWRATGTPGVSGRRLLVELRKFQANRLITNIYQL